MSDTVITITRDLGCRNPSPNEIPITAGNTVTFTAAPGAATTLSFTPDAASLLSPPPGAKVNLAGGSSVTYTFGAPQPRAYCVQVLPAGLPAQKIDCAPSSVAVLRVLPGCDPDFNGPDVPTGNKSGSV